MATRYVSTTGTDSGTALTPATAWLTLQHAEDNATAGDTVVVATGTYNENDATYACFNPEKNLYWTTDGGEVVVTSTSVSRVILPTADAVRTFTGFTFDGDHPTSGSATTQEVMYTTTNTDNCTFTDCTFKRATTYLWRSLNASEGFTFNNCAFIAACTGAIAAIGPRTGTT